MWKLQHGLCLSWYIYHVRPPNIETKWAPPKMLSSATSVRKLHRVPLKVDCGRPQDQSRSELIRLPTIWRYIACILLCVDPVPPPAYILKWINTGTQLKSLTNKKRMQKTVPHISPRKNASLNITLRKSNQSLRNLKCGWFPVRRQLQTFQYQSHPGATASWKLTPVTTCKMWNAISVAVLWNSTNSTVFTASECTAAL